MIRYEAEPNILRIKQLIGDREDRAVFVTLRPNVYVLYHCKGNNNIVGLNNLFNTQGKYTTVIDGNDVANLEHYEQLDRIERMNNEDC